MLDYNSWQEAQAKVEPLRKQVMEAILKDKRFNATIEDRDNLLKVEIKNTIFDLIFDLGNFKLCNEIEIDRFLYSDFSKIEDMKNIEVIGNIHNKGDKII